MWWAVVQQSAHDLRFAHRSLALDALEFLRDTGVWLGESLFSIPAKEMREEIVLLILRRNRFHKEALDI